MLATNHKLLYIILFIFFYALGGAPQMREGLIQNKKVRFQDIYYFYETSFTFSTRSFQGLILALMIELIVGGLVGVLKLTISTLLTLVILCVTSL